MLLLVDEPALGAWNMAVDEGLLEWAAEQGQGAVRLYGWSEPTLSLGYFQSLQDRCVHPSSLGCRVVRRASGGGAILHDREITYAVVMPRIARWSRQADALYDTVHTAWLTVLARQGVVADRQGVARTAEGGEPFLCFQRRSCGDLILSGAKILGSAQRRFHGAVLQHGSLIMERSAWAPQLPGIAELTNAPLDWDRLRREWVSEMEHQCAVEWSGSGLPVEVVRRARSIEHTKYGNLGWTAHR